MIISDPNLILCGVMFKATKIRSMAKIGAQVYSSEVQQYEQYEKQLHLHHVDVPIKCISIIRMYNVTKQEVIY